jgi:hypothetical protein
MRIRIRLITLMRIQIQVTKMMRIHNTGFLQNLLWTSTGKKLRKNFFTKIPPMVIKVFEAAWNLDSHFLKIGLSEVLRNISIGQL